LPVERRVEANERERERERPGGKAGCGGRERGRENTFFTEETMLVVVVVESSFS
jgi:hypothetical protein